MGTDITCQSPDPELLPPVPTGHGEGDGWIDRGSGSSSGRRQSRRQPQLTWCLSLLADHMILPVSLVFGHVTLTTGNMTFYDCGAVSKLNQSSQ